MSFPHYPAARLVSAPSLGNSLYGRRCSCIAVPLTPIFLLLLLFASPGMLHSATETEVLGRSIRNAALTGYPDGREAPAILQSSIKRDVILTVLWQVSRSGLNFKASGAYRWGGLEFDFASGKSVVGIESVQLQGSAPYGSVSNTGRRGAGTPSGRASLEERLTM